MSALKECFGVNLITTPSLILIYSRWGFTGLLIGTFLFWLFWEMMYQIGGKDNDEIGY